MKIAPLLAEYFYLHKHLDLPGIGRFLLTSDTDIESDHAKSGKAVMLEGASFETNPGIKESPELVNFIASTTGKIKALAAADLDSHLELARQFLNIGKPFLFEGIGSLTKLQTGNYSFSPGTALTEKKEGKQVKENIPLAETEESAGGFKTIFYSRKTKTDRRKSLFIFLLLIGLGLAIWGGYKLYKGTTAKRNSSNTTEEKNNNTPENKITDEVVKKDTITTTSGQVPETGSYKFIVEMADKTRGLKRYGTLKGFGLDIKMETTDSVSYKLYFILPATASDTARLIDSLRRLYTPRGNKAFVE